MAGLVPAIHVLTELRCEKAWMPGIKPGMTSVSSGNENDLPLHLPLRDGVEGFDRVVELVARIQMR